MTNRFRNTISRTTTAVMLAATLAGCAGDEPTPDPGGGTITITVKEEADRTVLIGTKDGKIYDMSDGQLLTTLSRCTRINSMAMHGDNYFVAGEASTGRVTYWHNGREMPLEAVGDSYAVAQSYNNVYVYASAINFFPGDKTYIYRNGIEVARSTEAGWPVALAAYGDKFYALSLGPKMWTNDAVTALPDNGFRTFATNLDLMANSTGTTYYATGHMNNIVNGHDTPTPCLWVNGTLTTLPVNFTDREKNNHTYREGSAYDVSHKGRDIYVAGDRHDGTMYKATVWIIAPDGEDQVKTYWHPDGNVDSRAIRTLVYGSDVYVMTNEWDHDTGTVRTRIWMNHELKTSLTGVLAVDFVVI